MTVKELIAKLNDLPDWASGLDVVISDELYFVNEVELIGDTKPSQRTKCQVHIY
jgi:hypothetical protein